MNSKKLKKFALPAALVAGGLTAGSLFAPIGFASAQESDADSDAPTTTEPSDSEADSSGESDSNEKRSGKRGQRGNRAAKGEAIAEALGLTTDDLKAGFAEGKSLGQIAEDNDVAVSDLKAAIVAAMNERIDEAVAAERIDADKAAEKKAELEARVDAMIEATPGERSSDGDSKRSRGHRGERLEGIAETLGLTTDEVREGLQSGQSLADLAAEQGVSEDDLVAALMEGIQERIDEKIESGDLGAEEAAERAASAEEKLEGFVNGEQSERGRKGHNRGDRGSRADTSSTEETGNA